MLSLQFLYFHKWLELWPKGIILPFISYKGEREGGFCPRWPPFLMFDLGTLYWYATSCLSLTPRFWFSWSYSRFNDPLKPDIPLSTDSTTAFRVSWYTKGISWTYLWSINFVSGYWIVAVMAPCSAQATCKKGDFWTVVYRSTATISSLLTFEYDAAAFFHCFQACIRGFFVI